MEIVELGRRLRARRTAAGRTIASVAADAGLSVPYIANLENGRGNPTLTAITGLAAALGADLQVDLRESDPDSAPTAALPDSLVRFARSPRFTAERPPDPERVLTAMATLGALAGRPMTDLDWHRILDTIVLITRTQ
ncbi:Transcriptional regulator, contains XRE-family HTH domain [Asanoa hainanensis]|uniref:Transcriptional regulator, contains XRE-family HTH domain n=1 Tax=Asanoa hainanensis TaxID=560556 RepID=A0A239G379_9ACTN|nr:transcriptional regulator [Asanoa hainanensis]SNS63178.1 Transcriptional regulator, contains XRE-family HTH domain [Asanoa hainanensis]